MQAVGFTSVCSTWCRGRGQSGAVISWYAAVRNEARARRMMLRGDDFWQFASEPLQDQIQGIIVTLAVFTY